jgi:hypothetical protein
MSRSNTIQKLIMLIDKMQIGGLWLKYARDTSSSSVNKTISQSRSLERGNGALTQNKEEVKSQSSGRRRNNAVMPVLSHSKQASNG